MNARAFLFDMDGTIVDNMSFHTEAWVRFFRQRGLALDADEFFRATAGRHSGEILRTLLREDLSDAQCHALSEEKDEIYRELYGPHLRAIDGFEPFVDGARARGVALAIGTAGPAGNIRFTLDGLGLRDRFDAVVGAGDVRRGKPAPDVFELAALRCGVPPADCIVFEDAPLGVEAARNAGMRCVALTTTLPAEAFAGYDNVIATVRDYGEAQALWEASTR